MVTRTASAGRYQTHGEDLIQFVDAQGEILCYADGSGILYGTDYQTLSGLSLQAIKSQLDSMSLSGVPSDIDCGSF